MARTKRAPTNSVAGQIAITKNVQKKIEPAYELNGDQAAYFNRVVRSIETEVWDENSILLATNLAVSYVQLDEANEEINTKGLMVLSEKGWPVTNPAITAKQSLMSTVLQLNKALGLSASQRGVAGAKQDARNKAEQKARAVISKVAEEDLI